MGNMQGNILKTLMIASLGSALEMYDFVIYIFFAPIIGEQFFPETNPMASLLLVFSVFAVGYFCRTIGAFLFGYLGDTHGRKKTLIYTISVMVLPLIVITFLPTYQKIGILAPIILTLMRCLQGLAVGGEFSGAITIVAEHADPKHRGYICSWVITALNLGILLASLVSVLITKYLIQQAGFSWGWRVAFLLGCILAIIIVYIRRNFEETPFFKAVHARKLTTSWIQLLYRQTRPMVRLILITIGAALTVGMIMFFPTYLQNFTPINSSIEMLAYNTFFLVILCSLLPCFGFLSDQYGRKRLMILGLMSIIVGIFPVGELLAVAASPLSMLLAIFLLALIISPTLSVFASFLAENFSTDFRATGIGLAYNIPFTLITGTFPLVSLCIVKKFHFIEYQYLYIILLAFIALLVVFTTKETSGKHLE